MTPISKDPQSGIGARTWTEARSFISEAQARLHRFTWPLLIKFLPALYAAGLVLFVIKTLPRSEFGQYGIAFAYINLIAGMSRGIWLPPLVTQAAIGRLDSVSGAVLRFGFLAAVIGSLGALVVLPMLGTDSAVAMVSGAILLVLVPRDFCLGIAQAEGKGRAAFALEAAYFAGAFGGFTLLWLTGHLTTALDAILANGVAALLSVGVGLVLFRDRFKMGARNGTTLFQTSSLHLGLIAGGDLVMQQADVLFVGAFFTPAAIAPYVAARTLVRLYTVLSQAVNFVLLPVASRLSSVGEFLRLRKRTELAIGALLAVLVPVNVIVWSVADWLLPALLGEKYIPAVPYFRVLVLMTFLEPVYSLVTNTMVGSSMPRTVVPVTWAGVVFNIAAMLALLSFFGLGAAPVVVVATYVLLATGAFYILRTHLRSDSVANSSV